MVKRKTLNDLVLLLINLFFKTDVLHRALQFLLSKLSWISIFIVHCLKTFFIIHDFLSIWLILKLCSSWKSNFSFIFFIFKSTLIKLWSNRLEIDFLRMRVTKDSWFSFLDLLALTNTILARRSTSFSIL